MHNDIRRNTLTGDYNWAAAASNLEDALTRWQLFFDKYNPKDGEFEDAPHIRLVRAAEYELLRVYYLRKEFEKADAMLKAIQKSADSKECELLRGHYLRSDFEKADAVLKAVKKADPILR